MFFSHLKIAVRYLLRHKGYSAINILGLGIGMACCFWILLWVQDELSFDKFHKHHNSIFRIVTQGSEDVFFGSPAPLAPTIEAEMPEIVKTTRLYNLPRFVFEYNGRSFYEDKGIVVDPAFFEIFTFPMVHGSFAAALSSPEHMVITESMAHKYFGDQDPISKYINIEGEGLLMVGGVLKDIPSNSHLQFDYALPFSFLENIRLCGLLWGDFNFKTYIQLKDNTAPAVINQKMTRIAAENNCPQIKHGNMSFFIQSLNDLYLHPVSNYDISLGNIRYLYIFSMIAAFILCIACINFQFIHSPGHDTGL